MPRIPKGVPSGEFYSEPRRVAPGDERVFSPLAALYRRLFPPEGAVLDLMSGCLCHLPPEATYRRVTGIGFDAETLAGNPFLDDWRVQNLNLEPHLPFASGEFEGAAICSALPCLTRPIEVLREVGRVLRPGAPLVIAFSRGSFGARTLACWRMLDTDGRFKVIRHYLAEAGNWGECDCHSCCKTERPDPLYAVVARSTG